MKNKQLQLLRILLALSDLALLNMCFITAKYLSDKYGASQPNNFYHANILPANALWLLCTSFFKLYNEYNLYKFKDICKATYRSIFLFTFIFQLYALISMHGFQREFTIAFSTILVISFTLSRVSAFFLFDTLELNFKHRRASIMAIASVGGHWIELLRLKPLFKTHDVTFVSNKADLQESVDGSPFYVVPDANRNNIFKLIYCTIYIIWLIVKLRPRVIITTGAAPGLIGILIGRLLGVKTMWIDSIANVDELSLSGRIATLLADKVYTQWGHLSTSKITFSGSVL